ncbi:MAG: 3-oxoacyl-ACP synthase [Candidatus Dadabacteria bacterium RIFCSPHIGHO2_12_FULL_53_21]|nr:MAG: 3-oxoacyl-ACP synthase [Candidatus Dadabacteria bacterium RIFCSPHIGHO2_12_FULL_53_21]
MSFVRFLGTGSYAPDRILTNLELEKLVDTSDEWIQSRTGIRERRIADPDVATSDIAYEASLKALESSGVDARDLDGIIVGTVTPDYLFPSTACILQSRLGAKKAFAFDILAGCSGFLYALQAGKGIIGSGDAQKILIIGAETLSKITDFQDRSTCILFGDGAGAAVISASETPGILSTCLGANGDEWELLYMPGGGSRIPPSEESIKNRSHFLKMKGKEVFKEAVKALESSSLEAIKRADITPEEIDLFIPHQANYRILEAVRKRVGLPEEKVFSNLDRYGNTSSASVPLALDEAVRSGRVKEGDTILISVFGAGFTWGAAVVRW